MHAAKNIHSTFVELLHVLLYSSVFSILQLLGNFLRSIPGEDGSSSPIHCTHVFSHTEQDLPIDWLPVLVVFEVQALVATQSLQILNFDVMMTSTPAPTLERVRTHSIQLFWLKASHHLPTLLL